MKYMVTIKAYYNDADLDVYSKTDSTVWETMELAEEYAELRERDARMGKTPSFRTVRIESIQD